MPMRYVIVGILVMAVLGGIAFYQWREPTKTNLSAELDGEYGQLTCAKEGGLPGEAAGKMYHVVGTMETPWALDGHLYRSGERIFLGYCDANGRLINN